MRAGDSGRQAVPTGRRRDLSICLVKNGWRGRFSSWGENCQPSHLLHSKLCLPSFPPLPPANLASSPPPPPLTVSLSPTWLPYARGYWPWRVRPRRGRARRRDWRRCLSKHVPRSTSSPHDTCRRVEEGGLLTFSLYCLLLRPVRGEGGGGGVDGEEMKGGAEGRIPR